MNDLAEQQATKNEQVEIAFRLWAPGKKSVEVIGSFNNWEEGNFFLENKEGLWEGRRPLTKEQHQYQFVVRDVNDKTRVVADPLSRHVNTRNARRGAITILDLAAAPFHWTDQNFTTPELADCVIYELHVGNFSEEGTFNGVTAKLDYLKDLGINAIELMPIAEFRGDEDWGYEPCFYCAPESAYGTPDDLKQLINEAHRRGIAVILDVVFNHAGHKNPLNQLYDSPQENPYLSEKGNQWGLPDFDHWNELTKNFFFEVQENWLKDYHADGFRYDHVEGIGYDDENGIKFLAQSAHGLKPDAILIAENLKEITQVVKDTEVQASWNEPFMHRLLAQVTEQSTEYNSYGDMESLWKSVSFTETGYLDHAQAINYIENHDHERLVRELQNKPELASEEAMRAKIKLALTAVFGACGVPMIYSGQEFGVDNKKTLDPSKLDWGLLEKPFGKDLHEFMKRIIAFRREHRAFRWNNHFGVLVSNDEKCLIVRRWDDQGDVVLMALNFAPGDRTFEIQPEMCGTWTHWLSKEPLETLGDGRFRLHLGPSEGGFWLGK